MIESNPNVREALHRLLDDAIDERERIGLDGFARDRLLSSASMLFKKLVAEHGVEVHHSEDRLSCDPDDRIGRLVSICEWAGRTLPYGGEGLTRAEALKFASELSDLRFERNLPDWLKPRGKERQSAERTRHRALAVCWAIAIRPFFPLKKSADGEVAAAFGVSTKTLNGTWRDEVSNEPAFKAQLDLAEAGHSGPGQPFALLCDGQRNLLLSQDEFLPYLKRHGQDYQDRFGCHAPRSSDE